MEHPIKNMCFDIATMDKAVAAGAIRKFKHPLYDIYGYDYTKECTYKKMWNDYEIASVCRGLVLDSTGKIVALPFPKFFNFEEPECDVKYEDIKDLKQFDALVKEDGSLGIVFFYGDKWNIMTRGSFSSDQAIKAQSWIDNKKYCNPDLWDKDITYLCEIVYPENQVVIDYNGFEGIILLGGYNIKTYKDLVKELIISDCPSFEHITQWCIYEKMTWEEFTKHTYSLSSKYEGYVVVLPDGRRFKLKGDEYKRLHKIRDNLSSKFIWEFMLSKDFNYIQNNQELPDELGVNLPEEYITEMKKLWKININDIQMYLSTLNMYLSNLLTDLDNDRINGTNLLVTQKDKAIYILKEYKDVSSYMFVALKIGISTFEELLVQNEKFYETVMKAIMEKCK